MADFSDDDKLDRLLRRAFPSVEVSPDFTLRLWRGLMKTARPPWMLPAPVLGLAAAVGMLAGVWTWSQLLPGNLDRLDLFGNAPFDSVAGTYLSMMGRS